MTYIIKPEGDSQGRGIFLSRRLDQIEASAKDQGMVVQEYLERPHLIDELKYDLRIYVLVYGVNPLRIYIHKYGLVRFCTESYNKPTNYNLKHLYMHLTNYAINKNNADFQQNQDEDGEEEGHKRSLRAILEILA
jgi:tubulin polyglutamylase TTLL6/13